jgi:hypothetical protein
MFSCGAVSTGNHQSFCSLAVVPLHIRPHCFQFSTHALFQRLYGQYSWSGAQASSQGCTRIGAPGGSPHHSTIIGSVWMLATSGGVLQHLAQPGPIWPRVMCAWDAHVHGTGDIVSASCQRKMRKSLAHRSAILLCASRIAVIIVVTAVARIAPLRGRYSRLGSRHCRMQGGCWLPRGSGLPKPPMHRWLTVIACLEHLVCEPAHKQQNER